MNKAQPVTYASAGVSQEDGDSLVEWLQKDDSAKAHPFGKLVEGIGGFASIFELSKKFQNPCLVSCTDGVGTKVKLASQFHQYQGVGQDLVAMCVNDLICSGAHPAFFLDYYAVGKLDLKYAQEFLTGVKEACKKSRCLLVGGETAEMPGVYQANDFDCAGFSVGLLEKSERLGPHLVQEGDALLAVESSGFHSNGYSLLRKIFSDDLVKWKDILLTPTHLYVESFLSLIEKVKVHAAAHITGGGILNIDRVIPEGLKKELSSWQWPTEFREVQKRSQLSDQQMLETLNCGIGFVVILPQNYVAESIAHFSRHSLRAFVIGKVTA